VLQYVRMLNQTLKHKGDSLMVTLSSHNRADGKIVRYYVVILHFIFRS